MVRAYVEVRGQLQFSVFVGPGNRTHVVSLVAVTLTCWHLSGLLFLIVESSEEGEEQEDDDGEDEEDDDTQDDEDESRDSTVASPVSVRKR